MRLEIAIALKEAADDLGLEMEVYEDYSGRFMYGGKTTAVTYEREADLMKIAAAATIDCVSSESHLTIAEFIEELPEQRDQLGNGLIAY